jgi:hypothetical protein
MAAINKYLKSDDQLEGATINRFIALMWCMGVGCWCWCWSWKGTDDKYVANIQYFEGNNLWRVNGR